MNSFIQIFKRECGLVISDHSILLTVIIAPMLYAFFLGSIYLNKDIEKIRFAIVDYDKSPASRRISYLIDATQKVDIVGFLDDYNEAVLKLKELKIEGFLVFNKGFERNFLRGEQQSVNLYLNTTRFLPSNDLNKTINDIFLWIGDELRLKIFEAAGIPNSEAIQIDNPVKTTIFPIYNTTNSYGGFLLPGLFFLILQQTLLIGIGESFARDSQNGVLKRVLSSAGNSSYFGGKASYYYILYIAYLIFFTFVVFPFFSVSTTNEYIGTTLVYLLFITSVILLAIVFGLIIKNQMRIMEILAFTSYPFFLLSGYSWPIESMPVPVQWLSYLIPTTPLMEAVKKLYVMGGGITDILNEAIHLSILCLLYGIILLIIIYRINMTSRVKTADS